MKRILLPHNTPVALIHFKHPTLIPCVVFHLSFNSPGMSLNISELFAFSHKNPYNLTLTSFFICRVSLRCIYSILLLLILNPLGVACVCKQVIPGLQCGNHNIGIKIITRLFSGYTFFGRYLVHWIKNGIYRA